MGATLTDRFGLRAVRALALARLGAASRVGSGWCACASGDLTLLLGSGLELRLGALRAIPLKLAVAQRVLPGLLAQGRYLYLDVSVPDRPVAGTTLNSQLER